MQNSNISGHTPRSKLFLFFILFFLYSLFVLSETNIVLARNTLPLKIYEGGGSVIADIAESRISGVVNISSTKVIKTEANQLMNPFFSDPFLGNLGVAVFTVSPKNAGSEALVLE